MSIFINGNPASGLPASYPSDRVTYDNTSSGLTSDDVQGAIDELASGGSGGHTIENPSGTDMTQRTNLQFVDAHLTDDNVNDRTEVENIKDITSADYANATEDGFYNVTDESDEELTAADIAYDSNDSIKEKIDEIIAGIVLATVTADGVKTYADIIDELVTASTILKLTYNSCISDSDGGLIYRVNAHNTTMAIFTYVKVSPVAIESYTCSAALGNGTAFRYGKAASGSTTINDYSGSKPTNGTVFVLYK